ncbi:MAG TPA: hypothetical protein VMH28_01560 [Candidatus Acidoferrales bacterium]|nr:hypothetical protein [Candidatus Acidoferrales bacterium]
MKLAAILFLGIALMGSFALVNASDPAGPSQVAIALTGGSVWTSPSTGICVNAVPVFGGLDWKSLYDVTPFFGTPDPSKATKETAYLIWVSDFSVQMLPSAPPFQKAPADPSPYQFAYVPAGTATIYFSPTPAKRDWSDLTNRKTWGEPVATFVRNASVIRSADTWTSDFFVFSANLASSRPFTLNGRTYDFKDLMPKGMTCFENGQIGSSWEVSTCVATGEPQ